ncbi:DUF1345 domain-containing protein [Bradyrhizobium sp. LHD-71]|uniref:DUF1345 domain-containing protein n=1 Tax=Bradyrhizobium sp. LHD-71 TaxID=3072141 RepID=UPI00280C7A4F|nr:DUF1345 domain-containing protein [Bradyrhizobium sp. LHD-71]MDQ8730915.1 DUF1345 domain-containing protein [Bradyrhizobium sp. LHD-71]
MNTGDPDRRSLDRIQELSRPIRFLRVRIRLVGSVAAGVLVLMLLPQAWRWTTRTLTAWDVTVVLYLVTTYAMIRRTDTSHIRTHAIAADDGRFAILFLTAGAALASLLAIVAEIGTSHRGMNEILLAVVTIVMSWAMVHTTFALNYAHDYYRPRVAGGLKFPGEEKPDYWDFIYFSFVIGMTGQVSDVAITDRGIRRTATAHGIVSFAFNTALLALMVNIAASTL